MTNAVAQTPATITEQVGKLLATANQQGAVDNAHEMKIIMAGTQKILLENFNPAGDYVGATLEVKAGPWFRRVAQAAAILCMCHMAYAKIAGTQRYKLTFTGKPENAAAATEMAQYLTKGIRKGYNAYKKAAGDDNRLKTNYRNAAANALVMRAMQMVEEAAANDAHKAIYTQEIEGAQAAALKAAGIEKFNDGALSTSISTTTTAETAAVKDGIMCGRTVSTVQQPPAQQPAEAAQA